MKQLLAVLAFVMVVSSGNGQETDLPYIYFRDRCENFPFVMDLNEFQQYTDRWSYWYGLGNDIHNQVMTDSGGATLELDNTVKRKGNSSYKITLRKNLSYDPLFTVAAISWKQPSESPVGVRWAAFSIFFPNDFALDNTPTSIMSIRQTPEDSIPGYPTAFEMFVLNDHLYVYRANISNGVSNGAVSHDLGPITRNTWMDFALNRNWTQADSGYMKLYKNGTQIWEFNGPNWLTGGSFQPEGYFVFGLSKWTWEDAGGAGWGLPDFNGTYTINYDEFKFGSTVATLQHMLVDGNFVSGNISPLANAGTSKSFNSPTSSFNQVGSGTDADGTISTYSWSQVAGPILATIATPNAATTNITGLTTAGQYLFRLTVTDNLGSIGIDDVPVTVLPQGTVSAPPVINSAPNYTIHKPTDTAIVSALIYKPDGYLDTTVIRYESGPKSTGVTLILQAYLGDNWPTYNLSYVARGLNAIGTYKFRVDVYDNSGNYATDYQFITVRDSAAVNNEAPVVDAGPNYILYLPNNTILVNGTVQDDKDGIGSLTYSWEFVGGPTGSVITNPGSLNTQITFAGYGIYNYILKCTDTNGATGADQIQIRVYPDERPIYKKIIYTPN